MKTKRVEVTFTLDVTLDESKFTPEVMQAFSECIYEADMDDHFQHLAFQEASNFIGFDHFVEGYGDIRELGVSFREVNREQEIIDHDVKRMDDE